MKDFNTYKFRASQISQLVTQPRLKKDREAGRLSATTETYLLELAIEAIYGRRKSIETDAMRRGTEQEQQAIDMLSELHEASYTKNEQNLKNDYITGTPDILEPLIDIKIPQDIFSYFSKNEIPKIYKYQLYSYMILTGATEGYIAYVLANSPEWLIEKEFNKRTYYTPEEQWQAIEEDIRHNHTFDDIPLEKRIKLFKLDWKEEVREEIYTAVERARNYMNNLTI
jgi:hypothetical protein